jgi:hypothetical protein
MIKYEAIIRERQALEKKYTRLALKHGYFNFRNGVYQTVTPTSYYHVTGVNASGADTRRFKELTNLLHDRSIGRGKNDAAIVAAVGGTLPAHYGKLFELIRDVYKTGGYFKSSKVLNGEPESGHVIRIEYNPCSDPDYVVGVDFTPATEELKNLIGARAALNGEIHYKLNAWELAMSKVNHARAMLRQKQPA